MSSHYNLLIGGMDIRFASDDVLKGVGIPADFDVTDSDCVTALGVALVINPAVTKYLSVCEITAQDLQHENDHYSNMFYEELKNFESERDNCLRIISEKYPNYEMTTAVIFMNFSSYIKNNIQASNERAQKRLDARKVKAKRFNTEGYVYLIQSPTEAYKIGCTKNPKNRMKTFGVKLPFEVEYIALIKSDNHKQLESDLHETFEDKRIDGEWFALTPDDVEYIKGLAE